MPLPAAFRRAVALGLAAGLPLLAACGGPPATSSKPPSTHAPAVTGSGPIQVLAAENFYGDIALQIGGPQVTVRSILSDPSADPHEYESSARDAEAVATAQLLIKNGAGYDAFIDKLTGAAPRTSRIVVDVGKLAAVAKGDNPHLWYRPDVPKLTAEAIAEKLGTIDPSHADAFRANARSFHSSLTPLRGKIDALRGRYQNTPVLPTEQVANYLLSAIGLRPAHGDFQRAVEEGTDPPPKAVQEFRSALTERRVQLVIYNTQTTSKLTDQMRKLAHDQGIPVVGVRETLPRDRSFQQWMLATVDAIDAALRGSR